MRKLTLAKLLTSSFLLLLSCQLFAQNYNSDLLLGGGDIEFKYQNAILGEAPPAELKLMTGVNGILQRIPRTLKAETISFEELTPVDVAFPIIKLENLEELYAEAFKQNINEMSSIEFIAGRVATIPANAYARADGQVQCPELSELPEIYQSPTFQCFEKRTPDNRGEWVVTRENALDVCSCLLDDIPKDKLFSQEEYQIIEGARMTAIKNKASLQFEQSNKESADLVNLLAFFNEEIPQECEEFEKKVKESCSDSPLALNYLDQEMATTNRQPYSDIESEKNRKTILPFIKAMIELSSSYPDIGSTYENLMNSNDMEFHKRFISAVRRNGMPDFQLQHINNIESKILLTKISQLLEKELTHYNRRLRAVPLIHPNRTINSSQVISKINASLKKRAKVSCQTATINASLYCNINNKNSKSNLLKQSVLLCDQQLKKNVANEQEASRDEIICDTLNISDMDFSQLELDDSLAEKHNKPISLNWNSLQNEITLKQNYKLSNVIGLGPLSRQSQINNEFFDHMFRCEYYTSLIYNTYNVSCIDLKSPTKIDECNQQKRKLQQLKEDNINQLMIEAGISEDEARAQIEENFNNLAEERNSFFVQDIETSFVADENDIDIELGNGYRQMTDGSVANNDTPASTTGAKTTSSQNKIGPLNQILPDMISQTPKAHTTDISAKQSKAAEDDQEEIVYDQPIGPMAPKPLSENASRSFFDNIPAKKTSEAETLDASEDIEEESELQDPSVTTNTTVEDSIIKELEQQINDKNDQLQAALAKLERTKIESEREKLEAEQKKLEAEKAQLEKEKQKVEDERLARQKKSQSPNQITDYISPPTTHGQVTNTTREGAPKSIQSSSFAGQIDGSMQTGSRAAAAANGRVTGNQYYQSASGPGLQLSRTQNVVVDKIEGNALVITREMFDQGKFRKDVNELFISTDKGYEKYIKNENGEFVPETEVIKIKTPLAEGLDQVGEAQDDPTTGIVEIPPLIEEPRPEEPRRREVISNEELENLLNTKDPAEGPQEGPVPKPRPDEL